MLPKLRHVLDLKTLRSLYYEPVLASLVWTQNTNSVKRLYLLQKKFLRIMLFQSRNPHIDPLFKMSKILKSFENCIFISKSLKGLLPSIFKNWFKFSFESHSYDTRWSNPGYLKIPSYRRQIFNSIQIWNHLQSSHQNVIFHQMRANKLKEVLITFSYLAITNNTSAYIYKLSILHRINLL